jgi:Ni/Co efflux regulator RcnB
MKTLLIAIAAALSIAAMIAQTTSTADARGAAGRAASGGRSHAWVHRGWAHRGWGRGRHCRRGDCGRQQGFAYDGYADVSPYTADVLPGYFPWTGYFLTGLPRGLDCRRSQETVTVPSEAGGVRQIVVRRCYP